MAYATADLTNVKKQVVSILNAHPGTWSATVATNPSIGAYPSNDEILLAILQADEEVATNGYFQSANDSLATPFNITGAPLINGDGVPFHRGTITRAEVSTNTETFTAGATNILTTGTAHGWVTGQLLSAITTGVLPTGISALTNYYAIVLTTNTLKIATSLANALAGTAVTVTNGSGSGTNTLISWALGVEAKNIDDITNALAAGESYVGSGSFDFLYKEDTGSIYTTATYCRLTLPEYVRTSTLQCKQSEEFLISCGAVKHLVKNASPAPFQAYISEFERGMSELIRDGVYTATVSHVTGGSIQP